MMDLYCQYCNELILNGAMGKIGNALVHIDVDCIRGYKATLSEEELQRANKDRNNCILYEDAEKLAKKGKVKFSRLEKETASVGGMGQ